MGRNVDIYWMHGISEGAANQGITNCIIHCFTHCSRCPTPF